MVVDILQEIADSDLINLIEIYNGFKPAPYVYSFLRTARKWRAKNPEYIKIYTPNGDWSTHGTFIALMKFSCYDFFLFTKEATCASLSEALTKTKRFDWNKRQSVFFAVHRLHVKTVVESVKQNEFLVDDVKECDAWWIPKEEALKLEVEIPPEVYLKKLDKSNLRTINQFWSHNFGKADDFLDKVMEMGVGYGLFLNSDDSLVCWIFKNQLGTLGMLHTVDDHIRKGYGSVITKILAKEVAADGHDPVATVLVENVASQKLFRSLGFKILDRVSFVECDP